MKLTFVAKFDPRDINKRSGTPYHMCQALEQSQIQLDYIVSLQTKLPSGFKFKRFCQKLFGDTYDSARSNMFTAKNYALQIQEKLTSVETDALITHIIDPVAYLETDIPIILWTDTTYAGLSGFNPSIAYHSAATIQDITDMTRAFFDRCQLAIFSSEWGARGAIELYGAKKEKVKVVPFGANLPAENTAEEVQQIIKNRSRDVIKLLFIGKDWFLKNGELVFKVTNELHAAGHKVELHFVGCKPPSGVAIPKYTTCYGYISKTTPKGIATLTQLLRDCHFLFVPSRSEAFGIVFCEANAFGMPCITSYVGGIPVRDHINGMTFSLNATSTEICDYIVNLMKNYHLYEDLALSSYYEYENHLNWAMSVKKVKSLIAEVI